MWPKKFSPLPNTEVMSIAELEPSSFGGSAFSPKPSAPPSPLISDGEFGGGGRLIPRKAVPSPLCCRPGR